MAKVENGLDIYYVVEMQIFKEKKTYCNYKKSYSAGWKLISTSTAKEDAKNQFSNLYLF